MRTLLFAFRQPVVNLLGALSLLVTPIAWAADAPTDATHTAEPSTQEKVKSTAHHAAQSVKSGAQKVAGAVEHGAQVAGQSIKKGAAKADHAIRHMAHKVDPQRNPEP